ncbi:MAG: glycosyl hydrolase [Verrucomicrobiota bacterium]|nr:glycosyl hydrolase [Verrucomicrobiota bacterium]
MKTGMSLIGLAILGCCICLSRSIGQTSLDQGWVDPPIGARLRAYWWWLNGNVTKAAITRDLEEMKSKGWGGALICDADGASQDGNDRVKHGPDFLSPEWRELYRHALREAARLGLEMSLNIQSGWNLGGPMVTADDAAKKLVWSETQVRGPGKIEEKLPMPQSRDGYYRDLFVIGYRLKSAPVPGIPRAARNPVNNWEAKAMHRSLHFSAPDTTPLLVDASDEPGEEDTAAGGVIDLTARLDDSGTFRWDAPDGVWQILRFGCTIGDHARVSTSSDGWKGYALDVLDAGAFKRYWDAVAEPLVADAGPLAGSTLKYLHTDSWEVEAVNWTPTLREEFRRRRGYDLVPWLPVLAGRIVNTRDQSNRFLHDFRKTLGDLAIDNHYRLFRDGAHRHGLQIHPESGGPHAVPIDAQRCLGFNDVPMSEFWAWSWRHRVGDSNRFFVKQPASAAHTYGRRLVAAEGFTTIGPHWQETIWDNLKPSFEQALCEGLNLLVWHAVVCSPPDEGLPGIQYFAGTHFNPNSTWWAKSGPFISYINRCQFMLQQGLFVADACYYYGDHVPNFAQLKHTDPARVLPGFDYDVITEEALLTRLSVRDGQLVLPDGMSYRVLVLPDREAISLSVLRKIRELVNAGATVIGRRPAKATGLGNYPECDAEVARIADELWGPAPGRQRSRARVPGPSQDELAPSIPRGKVFSDRTARAVLIRAGVLPDFECKGMDEQTALDYIHRRDGETDIYFVANKSNRLEKVDCTFRVAGKAPEIWDAVTGFRQFARAYKESAGRTTVPMELAPYGSTFVVFRGSSDAHPPVASDNTVELRKLADLTGPWTVHFPAGTNAPEKDNREMLKSSTRPVTFERLISWTEHEDPGIRFYSGTASYEKTIVMPEEWFKEPKRALWLDLGSLRELAEVWVNGQSMGVLWAPPWRVEITTAAKPGTNTVQIEVVNFWPNRIIGDQFLPPEKRFTRTNIRKLTRDTPLMTSGLLGPVSILSD